MATDKVGPVNLFLQSLFSTTEVTLQNKVTLICNNNPYIAMLQALLQYGEDANLSQLSTQLFIKDDCDAIDAADPAAGGNSGLASRAAYTSMSKIVDMCGPVYHPLFNLDRYLLNQVDVKLKLYRTSPGFCLMSAATGASFLVELIDVCLLAKKIRVNPAALFGHAEMLKEVTAKYPYTLNETRLQSVAQGSSGFHWDAIFQSRNPLRLL